MGHPYVKKYVEERELTVVLVVEASASGDFGTVGGDASFCGASRRLIPLSPAEMAALTADGVVQVQVTNNYAVDPTCSVNSHTVRLRYNRAADAIDFGTVFLGSSRTSHLTIRNVGRDVHDVTSIAADLPDVVATPSSVQVPMRGSAGIDVVFTPTAAGLLEGTLRIRSNDPDEQELTVAVHGIGRIPPDIEVIPSRVMDTQPLLKLR